MPLTSVEVTRGASYSAQGRSKQNLAAKKHTQNQRGIRWQDTLGYMHKGYWLTL